MADALPANMRRFMEEKNKKGSFTNRAPLVRMMRFHHLVQLKEYPNCTQLAQEFEVSVRTIMRDVEYMQNMLKLPLEYDAQHQGYIYTKPVRWLFSAASLQPPSGDNPSDADLMSNN